MRQKRGWLGNAARAIIHSGYGEPSASNRAMETLLIETPVKKFG